MIQLYKNCLTSTVVLPKISQGTSDARITIKCILNNFLNNYFATRYIKTKNYLGDKVKLTRVTLVETSGV